MGFGKSFGLGLVLYLVLNLAMSLVYAAVHDASTIGSMFTLEGIFVAMLSPVMGASGTWTSLATIMSDPLNILFAALVLIIPGLIASLVAGKSSDSAGAAFGGWFLAPIIVAVIIIVLGYIPGGLFPIYNALISFGGLTMVLTIILEGVTCSFLWGGIAAITAGP